MKQYRTPYDVIQHVAPERLEGLPEDAKDALRYCVDFEPVAFCVNAGSVNSIDTISSDVISTDTIEGFVAASINYATERSADQ